jgi:tRNA G18 (ribose-2'-O)-methylase SpoU
MIAEYKEFLSLDSPELEDYRTLKRPHEHMERGIFIIEGAKVVERFFNSSLVLVSILMTPEWFMLKKDELEARPECISVYIMDRLTIAEIVGFRYHQGIMAVGKVPESYSLDSVVQADKSDILVALDNVISSENIGALVRNCAACGVGGLVTGETSADPYLRRSVRNSMGNLFNVPVIRSEKLTDTLDLLRNSYNYQIVAAHPRTDSISLEKVNFNQRTCVVFGNENDGVSEDIISKCNVVMTIPMVPGVDSFNVACASAIVLYESMRQKIARNY